MHGRQNGDFQNAPSYGTYPDTGSSAEIGGIDVAMSKGKPRNGIYVEAAATLAGLSAHLRVFGNHVALNVAALILLPWALFTVVMLPFALAWGRVPAIAWTIWLLSAVSSAFIMWISTRPKAYGKPPIYWLCLGGLCLFATTLAAPVGIYDYEKYTQVFYFYEESPAYSNVLPTEDPGALQDAGSITFSGDALVDPRLSVGYKSGRVYCIAPIISSHARDEKFAGNSTGAEVANFFAVGFDCCPTGHFKCGPVDVKSVRGGLRVLDVSKLDFPVVPKFLVAAKQVGSTYGLTVPDDAIFIEWHRDAEHDQTFYWDLAIEFYLNAVVMYLLVVLGAGICGILVYDTYRRTLAGQSAPGQAK